MSQTTSTPASKQDGTTNITLIGAGTIGLSFAALHLNENKSAHITIHDTRPDLESYVHSTLPPYLSPSLRDSPHQWQSRLRIEPNLAAAVSKADIIQEQGPENLPFKSALWPKIEDHASNSALLWSSTSGIPASAQSANMHQPSRLVVVHPYNPPHIMPLLEIVPSPDTSSEVLDRTLKYWRALGRQPIVMKKECTGFVSNRLAFALLREAISLVRDGVIGVEEVDELVQTSMGPRWAVAGPFKSYHAGGGDAGLAGFMRNIGGTMRACWAAGEEIKVGPGGSGDGWEDEICAQTQQAYGKVDTAERDRKTRAVLEAVAETGSVGHERS